MRRWAPVAIFALIVALAGGWLTLQSTRSEEIVIATNLSEGMFDGTLANLEAALRADGFDVRTVDVAEDTAAIAMVQDDSEGIDAAILAMPIDRTRYPDVTSVGTFMQMPVLVVVNPVTTKPGSDVRSLMGKRIEVGPIGSMREATVMTNLGLYGIAPGNTFFLNDDSQAALAKLRDGRADAVVSVIDPFDPLTSEIAQADDLDVIPLTDAAGLSALNRYTFPATIPSGGFGLNPPDPEQDIQTVSVPASLVVRSNISGAAAYAMAEYLDVTYGRGSLTGLPGQFPNFEDAQLPPNPLAVDFYANGEKPWQYKSLPHWLADSFAPVVLVMSLIVVFAAMWGMFMPDTFTYWRDTLRPHRHRTKVARLEQVVDSGAELSPRQRRQVDTILREHEAERQHGEHVARIHAKVRGHENRYRRPDEPTS